MANFVVVEVWGRSLEEIMNRRSGKAPYSSSAAPEELSTHLARHLHLAHNLHVKNRVHMHRKDMLDPRQLPLRRELTAVKKVKSLRDPSTSSYSFSPSVAACNSHACRSSNGHGEAERAHRRREEFVDRNRRGRGMDEYVPRSELFSRGGRWQGDAAEIARRLIAEQNRRISSPSALSLLDDVTTSDSCEDGEAGLIMASEHLSNSAGSPLVIRGYRNRRRWKDTSASRCRRAADELEITCGMPWYKPTSSANKYKSKSLLNHTCEIPEPRKSATDSEQASRHGSQPPARESAASVKLSQCEDDAPRVRNSSMSYKYRPRSFKDIVGQTIVVKSLSTTITKGRLSQVYLFSGPRGTGKTTIARVFAAALVCLNVEPHRRPCGLCRECATLTLNRSRNVKEIDAAGIPDALLNLSHQVFIVKGCESLGMELWTKLLDELPKNVVCILIATDLERLPFSATSRCQKYHFGKLKEAEIFARLRFLSEKEKLDVEEAALSLIASRAEGSLRDAESTLDQLSLLEQTITLSMVQELSGLIPDEKLLDLLDTALAANTVNTVKTMRALLDVGVDALSLVAQLASLITNILAGTFELRRDKPGSFFHRNLPKREEQRRLRQALKVLAESEKQLRVSNDRPTWLTAALLQFAPDKSYLPSSVDTSPIAFDTLERLDDQPCTPRLPPPQPSARKHSQKCSSSTVQGQKDKEKAEDKVSSPDASRGGNRDFKVVSLRDMERIWDKVLDGCRSNVLRQLLSSHGALTALSITSDETFAVAHVKFQTSEHKARAERLRSSTCHAFQMALGCPVELKLSLQHCSPSSSGVKAPPDDSSKSPYLQDNMQTRSSSRHEMLTGLAARSRRLADAGSGPRLSSASDYKYCFPAAHGASCRYRSGRRPPLTRANSLDAPVVIVRRKHPKVKGITGKNRKLKPRRKRTGVASFCCQSPLSDLEQPENMRKVGFCLRLVPCGRSIQTIGSPNRP